MALAVVVIGLAAVVVAIFTVLREIMRQPMIRRARLAALTEKHRNRFGELRTRLVALARDEGLHLKDPDFFRGFYEPLSLLMREPGAYESAALVFIRSIPEARSRSKQARTKSRRPTLSHDEAVLALNVADALDELCRDFVWSYRLASRIAGQKDEPLFVRLMKHKERTKIVKQAHKRVKDYADTYAAA